MTNYHNGEGCLEFCLIRDVGMTVDGFPIPLARVNDNFVNFSISSEIDILRENLNGGRNTSSLWRSVGMPLAKTRFFWITLVR